MILIENEFGRDRPVDQDVSGEFQDKLIQGIFEDEARPGGIIDPAHQIEKELFALLVDFTIGLAGCEKIS